MKVSEVQCCIDKIVETFLKIHYCLKVWGQASLLH